MIWMLSTTQARNLFYGGSVIFLFLFLAMIFDTSLILARSERFHGLDTDTVLKRKIILGKRLWEKHDCIGCHTLLGEGGYFAPELSNVYQRYHSDREAVKSFIRYRFLSAPTAGRRTMPQFNFTESELDAIVEFLNYSSKLNTVHWPPHIEG